MRIAILMLMLGVGCAAPQRSGGERTAFISMATASGALVGTIGGVGGCHFLFYGLAHNRSGADARDTACFIAGTLIGGAAALYGSLESEAEPDAAQWAVVSLGSAAVATMLAAWAF